MKKLFIYALAMVGQAAFAIGPNEVCLYEDSGYNGSKSCHSLDAGTNQKDISFLDSFNDKPSSIEIGSNVKVELFEHGSFGGQKWSYATNNSWLDAQNDQASSMKIISKTNSQVCLYEHGNYQGEKTCWDYNGVSLDIPWVGGFNDKASSITMPTGASVTGYENGYYGGTSWTYNNNTQFFGNNDNDRWSSFKVRSNGNAAYTEKQRVIINFVYNNWKFQWLAYNLYNGGAISTIIGSTLADADENVDVGKWIITTNKEIRSVANPNLCVGRETANSTTSNVNLYNCDRSNLQKWNIEVAEPFLNSDTSKKTIQPDVNDFSIKFKCSGGFGVNPSNSLTSCLTLWKSNYYFRISVIN